METLSELTQFPPSLRGCVLSIGKFDGLHLGHVAILSRAVQLAKTLNVPAAAFTFDPTPSQVLRPEKASRSLLVREQKIELFERLGLDALIIFPTTREFLQTTAEDFFREVIVGLFNASALVEGDNFYFGRDAEGTKERLAELCAEAGVRLEIVQKQYVEGLGVSSSHIRQLISSGEVRLAGRLLGRPYEVWGEVRPDEQRGRELDRRTANLYGVTTLTPLDGVYAGAATLDNGEIKPAAVNLGGNPTFGVARRKFEAHLLDYDGDLYGKPLKIAFLERLRDIGDFNGDVDALKEHIAADVVKTREIFSEFYPLASE